LTHYSVIPIVDNSTYALQEARRCTPELRILHLRQRNYMSKNASPPVVKTCDGDPTTLAQKTHQGANAFFDYLHTHEQNLKLTALVVRCYIGDNIYHAVHRYYYLPQSCFVRGYQTNTLCHRTAVAVPISRAVLRASESYADILDWDPGCTSIWNCPGRFNST
jgi:hypothetical protein